HHLGAGADGAFALMAAAPDIDPEKGRDHARSLGVDDRRAYGSWQEMLTAENAREADRLDLVTVATPNASHYGITRAFLAAGFHVLCEKPMTMTVAEGEEIVRLAAARQRICAVNYCYSAYPLVRHMRRMVARGDLGAVRVVVVNFSHGHHANAADADNPRIRWRYDPAVAGMSGQMADCGIHALHLATFITGQPVERVAADFVSCVPGRSLEDDAMVNFRLTGDIVGRLWTSTIAIGRQHGLDIQIFGEAGGLRWTQEHPNQVFCQMLGGRTEIIEKGEENLGSDAARLSRVVIGSPEGFPMAIANIYLDLAAAIRAHNAMQDLPPTVHYPSAIDGLRSVAAVEAAVKSARDSGSWQDARPPMDCNHCA
ncbi:MAG: Gfo/Idh/MocA family oxidoreductase, partial [Rhodobacteraceae bacterium]|nr:Gfo/Idh/MocA family oxidoreductase [Paracoccaceae bacterium]